VISEQFALIIAALNLLLAAMGGGALGVAVALVLRLRWSWARLFGDMLVAVVATLALVLAVALYDSPNHTIQPWIFISAGASAPALGHLLIFLIRRTGRDGLKEKPR
jgi:hypothetical protein